MCIAAALFATQAGAMEPARGANPRPIIYFDPDANFRAIVTIKSLLDSFFRQSGLGDLSFQPVQSQGELEKLLGAGNAEFVWVAASFLSQARAKRLEPLLVPSSKQSTHYRKVLVDKGVGSAARLSAKTIAATAADPGKVRELLTRLLPGSIKLDGITGIPVAKDIDALLALSFGQVDAALVTPASIEVLRRINPAAVSGFRKVHETALILRPVLCRVRGRVSGQRVEQLTNAVMKMSSHPDGRSAMQFMGFDEWVQFRPEMLR